MNAPSSSRANDFQNRARQFDHEDGQPIDTFAKKVHRMNTSNVTQIPMTSRRRWAWVYLASYSDINKLRLILEANMDNTPLSVQKRFMRRMMKIATQKYRQFDGAGMLVKYCQSPLLNTILTCFPPKQYHEPIVYYLIKENDLNKWKVLGPHLNLKRDKSSVLAQCVYKSEEKLKKDLFDWLLPQVNPKGNNHAATLRLCEKIDKHPEEASWRDGLDQILKYSNAAEILFNNPEKAIYAVLIPYLSSKGWEKLKKNPNTIYQQTSEFQKRLLTDILKPEEQTSSNKRKM